MNNIAVIPARGGSKRLENKNVRLLGGIPLLAHSILFAKNNRPLINDVYVTTDDAGIKEVALAYGAKVIDRPGELSGDLAPTVTAIKHVLQNVGHDVDNVVLLQPTNPLRPANLLEDAFKLFMEAEADSLMTVSRDHHKLGKITGNKFIPFNYTMGQRSQDLEPLYFENGLLYICKPELILQEQILGTNNYPMIVHHISTSVDIDTQEDFDYAEYIYSKMVK